MQLRRYELKFPIDVPQKAGVLERARHGLQEDPHGRNAAYRVSSVYFDTPDLSAFWEKLDGQAVRKKFRLRYYSISESTEPRVASAFMEIKHRVNSVVYKERVRLTEEGANAILDDGRQLSRLNDHVSPNENHKRATIDSIVRAAAKPGFAAVHVISYLREAWMGRLDDRLRLTFDSCCQAYPPGAFLDVGARGSEFLIPPDMFVMEIKFDHAIPRWIRDISVREGVILQRFSKYAAGVEAIGLHDAGGRTSFGSLQRRRLVSTSVDQPHV